MIQVCLLSGIQCIISIFLTNSVASRLREFSVKKIKPFEFKSNFLSSCIRNKSFEGTVRVTFMVFPVLYFLCFFRFCDYPYLSKNIEIISEKMKILGFRSNFHGFHVRYNSQLKFSFRQPFVLIPRLKVRLFLCFDIMHILKNWRNFSEKNEIFRILVIFFKAFVLGITRQKN